MSGRVASGQSHSLVIREAVVSDVPVLLRFLRGLAEHEGRPEACVVTEDALRTYLFGARRLCDVVIAEQDDEPAGCAIYFRYFATFLGLPAMFLEDLFVLPEWQGRGVGRALLAYVARIAVDEECGRFEWGVQRSNEAAIGFYRRLGATIDDSAHACRLEGDALRRVAGSEPR